MEKFDASGANLLSVPLHTFRRCLKDCMYEELTEFWSKSSHSAISHDIHPRWAWRKLPSTMHCRTSHVWYNRTTVNRGPFRRCKSRKCASMSTLCRYDCNVLEDEKHVLFECPAVAAERKIVRNICNDYGLEISVRNLMSRPQLQIAVEKLLMQFFKDED